MDTLTPAYDPLQYTLLFPHGEVGWTTEMCWHGSIRRVPMLQFYTYRLQQRLNEPATLHYSGRLFQQYVVDIAAKVEQNELNFWVQNQQITRADLYQGICDLVADDVTTSGVDAGRRIVLPASYPGAPHFMRRTRMGWPVCALKA